MIQAAQGLVSAILVLLTLSLPARELNDTLPPSHQGIRQEEVLYLRIENQVEASDQELDYSELLEDLESLKQNPLNLNQATAADLHRLLFLNDIQVSNLLRHISLFGKLISIYELQSIDGFDLETIARILPFITTGAQLPRRHFDMDDVMREGRSQFFVRYQQLIQQQRGFVPPDSSAGQVASAARYPGSSMRLYSRYRFTWYRNISLGFTAEKDPGEEFFRGSQPKGFDFYSWHLVLRDMGRLRVLALGDYQVQYGQGLVFWSGMSFGKSSDAMSIRKNAQGILPYTSAAENRFMRGAAATLAWGSLELSAFWSGAGKDANVLARDSLTQQVLSVTSLGQSGLHRTAAELQDKDAVKETILGANLSWRRNNMQLGITGYSLQLDAELQRNLSFYNQFDLNQRSSYNLGIDYSFLLRNFYFFGETALSANGGFATLNGLMASLGPMLSFSVMHRKFSRDYQSLYASSFGENSRVANEQGWFMGLTLFISAAWKLSAYADHFSFPWMKYRTYMPSRGYDYLAQLEYSPSRQVQILLRYRTRNKPLNSARQTGVFSLDEVVRDNYRLHLAYSISTTLTLRSRIETTGFAFAAKREKGFLAYQDILFRSLSSPWALTFRYALFDTDGFDSRIYAYENDVLYAFSFPFYADKGSRIYLVGRYRLSHHVDLYARLAHTRYTNRKTSGSGMDEINGPARTEIKAQIRIKF